MPKPVLHHPANRLRGFPRILLPLTAVVLATGCARWKSDTSRSTPAGSELNAFRQSSREAERKEGLREDWHQANPSGRKP